MNTKKTIEECIRLSKKNKKLKNIKNFLEWKKCFKKNDIKIKEIIKNDTKMKKYNQYEYNLLSIHENETLEKMINILQTKINEFDAAIELRISSSTLKNNAKLTIKTILQIFDGDWFLEENFNFEKIEWRLSFDELFSKILPMSAGEKRIIALSLFFYDREQSQKAFRKIFEKDDIVDFVFSYQAWDPGLSQYIQKIEEYVIPKNK